MSTAFGSMSGRTILESGVLDASPEIAAVQLLLGPYRAGKTRQVVERVIDRCRRDPFAGALVIVPSVRYQKLFEERVKQTLQSAPDGKGMAGLRVMPFYRACQYLLLRFNTAAKVVPDQVRPAIVARVLSSLKAAGELKSLLSLVDFAGMHSALLELFDELERAGLPPPEVLARLERTAHEDANYVELARIYQAYWQELSQLGYVDERGLAFLSREVLYKFKDEAANLRGCAPDSVPGVGKGGKQFGLLAVDGFDRLNRLQLQVLEALSFLSHETVICFDYLGAEDDQEGEYQWKQGSYEDLLAIFGQAEKKIVNLKQSSAAVVTAFSAADRLLELEEIARRAKEAVAKGTKPSDILVVARSLRPYQHYIEAVFEEAGLTCAIDESIKLASLPVIKFILKLLHLSSHRFARKETVDCLRSIYLNRATFSFSPADVEMLDRLSMESRIVRGAEQWLQLWQDERMTPRWELKTGLSNFFDRVTVPAKATLYNFCRWVEDTLSLCLHLRESVNEPLTWQEQQAIVEFRRCLAGLLHEENIMGALEHSSAYLLERLAAAVEKANFQRPTGSAGGVTVCSADLAPNRSYEVVLVAGLVEGEFPKRAPVRGFISAEEIARWASFDVDLRNPRFHPGFEAALFKSLVKRARSQVHLSYCQFAPSGEELVPSFLLTSEVKSVERCAPFAAALVRPLSARGLVAAALWNDCGSAFVDLELTRDLFDKVLGHAAAARARAFFPNQSEFNGNLAEHVRAGALKVPVPERWSATRLNDYGKCPFRYWVSHQVRSEPWQEPEDQIDPLSLGQTYHLALERFYRDLIARGLTWRSCPEETLQELYAVAVNSALGELEARKDVRLGEFWRYQRLDMEFRLRRFLTKEITRAFKGKEDFQPFKVEAAFGMDEGPPGEGAGPLIIEDGQERIAVRGRIDRLDLASATIGSANKRVRVVDYKSGTAAISPAEAVSGRNIQLPLYALAVERSILPGSKVEQAVYLSVSSGDGLGRMSFVEQEGKPQKIKAGEVLDQVENHVRRFVRGIKSGQFTVRPNDKSVCSGCRHRQICRIGEVVTADSYGK